MSPLRIAYRVLTGCLAHAVVGQLFKVDRNMDVKTKYSSISIFTLPTFLATFPFAHSRGVFKISTAILTYGIVLRVLAGLESVQYVYGLYAHSTEGSKHNRFYYITVCANHLLNYLFVLVSYLCLLKKNKSFECVLKNCMRVDHSLFQLGVGQCTGYKNIYDVLFVSLALSGPVITASVSNYTEFLVITHILGSLFVQLGVYMSMYPFIRMLDIIGTGFTALKDQLLHLHNLQPGLVKRPKVVTLAKLHSILSNSCALLNDCFSVHLILMYSVVFTNVVTGIFFIFSGIHSEEYDAMIFVRGAIIIYNSSVVCLVTYLCNKTSQLASEFNTLLYKLMMDNNMFTEKILFLHISMKREVVFTAWGFFGIDNTLIHSMVAAATTYLLILIQYGNANS